MKLGHFLLPSAFLFLAACSQPAETPAVNAPATDTVRTAAPVDTVNNAYDNKEVQEIEKDTTAVAR